MGRRTEAGYALLATFVALVLASYAIVNVALLSQWGTIGARTVREAEAARMAASDVLRAPEPSATGGAVAPAAPLGGWSDTVVVDPSTQTLRTYAPGEAVPKGALIVRRQWSLAQPSGGSRIYSVSAEILDSATRTPRPGVLARRTIVSREVE